MLHKTKGVVLHHFKYSETSVVVHIYTDAFGRQAYLINGIRSRKSRHKMALLQPLSLVDMEVYHNPKKDLQRIKEFSASVALQSIPYDMSKTAISFFLAEILFLSLREVEPNSKLYEFLYNSVVTLDVTENLAIFHAVFLLRLSKHLGFYPINNYSSDCGYFNLKSGKFVASPPPHPHFMVPELAAVFSKLFLIGLADEKFPVFDAWTRNELLDKLVEFYRLHVEGLGNIKTLGVLREVFH